MFGSRVLSVAAMCAAGAMLTGCSPGIVGFIGVERTGGSFRAIVTMCEGSAISVVELRDRSLVNASNEYQTIEEWGLGDSDGGIAFATIPKSSVFPDSLGNSDYMLWGTIGGLIPSVARGPVFSVSDIEALRDGEILTVAPHMMDEVVYPTAAAMLEPLADYCG